MNTLTRSSLRALRMHHSCPTPGKSTLNPSQRAGRNRFASPAHNSHDVLLLRSPPIRQLTTTSTSVSTPWSSPASSFARTRTFCTDLLKLSKYRLSGLVAFTATAGYLCRADEHDSDPEVAHQASQHFYRNVLATTVGTYLTAASANTLNQLYEMRTDALMARTRLRPLPAGRVGRMTAAAFALVTGGTGLTLLQTCTNSVATATAAANLTLYAAVYTPLKAISTLNTWVGALVGALPPIIGWTAASGGRLSGERERGAFGLAALLFLWQIPHFHALAVALRGDYAAGGLRMLGVSKPVLNARWAVVTAAALVPIGGMLREFGVTNDTFVWQSTLLSLWMANASLDLLANPLSTVAAKRLFRVSIWHLPLSLGVLLASRAQWGSLEGAGVREARWERGSEIHLHQPWEVIAPFPFLPVPRGPPAVVLDVRE